MTDQPQISGAAGTYPPPDDRCPDVYFTRGYGLTSAVTDNGVWEIAHQDDRIMVPYVRRQIDHRWSDGASPYGFAGIYLAADRSHEDLSRFWERMTRRWRDDGIVSLFLRFSPLDVRSLEASRRLPGLRFAWQGENVTIPVDSGPNRVWDQMVGRARTAVRKAERSGLTSDVRPVSVDDLGVDSHFRRLYEHTMARLGTGSHYFFPDSYYRALAHGLGKNLLIAEVRDAAAEVVAAALVLRHAALAHYHLAGSTVEAARAGANNMLVWSILRWAAENNCHRVHLGGGTSARDDDTLLSFKRSFGGERTPFWTASYVVDPEAYATLVDETARRTGRAVADVLDCGWFPAYRSG